MPKLLFSILDLFLPLVVLPGAWLMKMVRAAGVYGLPRTRKMLLSLGVFPIRNHYYEPKFDNRRPERPFAQDRVLPGIDWNIAEQLETLDRFTFSNELKSVPTQKTEKTEYHFNNGMFESGDAEYWYQIVRLLKPRTIIEVGSGYSTLIAIRAIEQNRESNPDYVCDHICIEPFEAPWLEEMNVSVIRKKVEDVGPHFFSKLAANDILFIDSSHVIKPQGDVLFEYLELLPSLNKGVVVHLHDIFSPKDYPHSWLADDIRFWNEQYLLEAFLTDNQNWKVVGAVNFLHHTHYKQLKAVAPYLTPDREPGSFYIQKRL